MRKEFFLLAFILGIAVFLRFWKLGIVPTGVTHDELGYIYNSYSISATGKNVFGEFLPFVTWMNKGGWPFLPVPIYVSVPFFWLFGLSATIGRLPSALLGVADVFLVYLLAIQIFKKKGLALLSAFFLAISPWHIHFSRSAYDTNYSLFFFLAGIVVFLYEIKYKKLPIFSPMMLFFANFSYRGMNVVFPALTLMLIWYGIKVLNMRKKELIVFLIGVAIVVVAVFTAIVINGRGYTSEILFDEKKIKEEVDSKIREASGPLLIRRMFVNKLTNIVGKLRENYIKSYSPEFLFLYTEPSGIYSIWSRGRIYFLDLFLIILGFIYILKLELRATVFLCGMLLIGGIPGMIGGIPYSSRNFFMSAFFPIFSAGGALFILNLFAKRIAKISFILTLACVYSYLLGSYLFDYYGRYANQGAEYWAKSLKDLSVFIKNEKNSYKKIIVGDTSFGDFMQYMFYLNADPKSTQNAWRMKKNIQDGKYIFTHENVDFVPECVSVKKHSFQEVLINRYGCKGTDMPTEVIKDFYKNPLWDIYIISDKEAKSI